jgi:hypothetical protein
MDREIVIDTPGLMLWYYPDAKIIHHELHKYPGVAALEAALERGLEVLQSRGARKWLSDNRRGGAVPRAHHEWAQTVWGPKAAAAGWKYWAVLPPTEPLGHANVNRLIDLYAALGVTARSFGHPEPAMQWLISPTRSPSRSPTDRA